MIIPGGVYSRWQGTEIGGGNELYSDCRMDQSGGEEDV